MKRYARLTIPIAVTSLISLALAAATPGLALPGAESAGRSAADLVGALRFCLVEAFYKSVASGVHGPTYNGVLWTIPIEFQGSLLLIAVFSVTRRLVPDFPRWRDQAGMVCMALLLLTFHSRLGLFGAGATMYWLFATDRLKPLRSRGWAATALLVLALFLGTMPVSPQRIGAYDMLIGLVGSTPETGATDALQHPLALLVGWQDHTPYRLSPILFWHSIAAVLTLWTVFLSPAIARTLGHRFCQWLGRLSFPLYLIHSTVYRTVGPAVFGWASRHDLGYGVASLMAVCAYLTVALVAADLLARSLEKNSVRWSGQIGQWVQARRPAPPRRI